MPMRPIVANLVGGLVVVSATASTLFGELWLAVATTCSLESNPMSVSGPIAGGLGAVSLTGWVLLLTDRTAHAPQIGACSAMSVVILTVFAWPTVFIELVGSAGPGSCGMSPALRLLAAACPFGALIAAYGVYLAVRFLPRRPQT